MLPGIQLELGQPVVPKRTICKEIEMSLDHSGSSKTESEVGSSGGT